MTRREWLASGVGVALAGSAGCVGPFGGGGDGDDGGSSVVATDESGDLEVTSVEQVGDGGRTVTVAATVQNGGEAARQADLVVTLSHTNAEGSIDRERFILVAGGLERDVVVSFRPTFFSDNGVDVPDEGEFEFDASFASSEVVEDYPGLAPVEARSALAGGAAWPGVAYDAGASAHSPGTTAPRSDPSATWTASDVEYAFDASGPVVADGTVYAGRAVRALDVESGEERWAHTDAARTSTLAVGEGAVVFGTPDGLRAVDAASGEVRWSQPGRLWKGGPTIADGSVYAVHDELYAIDAASGDVRWRQPTDGSLLGPPPVADGVVVAGGEPLRAYDAADGSALWTGPGNEPVVAASVAYDTVYALTESYLVALDLAGGRIRWFAPGPFYRQRIAVGNGSVYVQTAGEYRLAAYDAENGNAQWLGEPTEGTLGPPAASDGVLVVLSDSGLLYGVDTETGDRLWTKGVRKNVPGAVAIAAGTVYVNEPQGPLYALSAGQ